MMTIAVFGLGYVGAVSVAALAEIGHTVIGVDPNESKVQMVNEGKSPIVEAGVAELMERGQRAGRISATSNAAEAVALADVSIICVGTPSRANGSLELGQIENVCAEIGNALSDSAGQHHVIVRSTMLPGSMFSVVLPTLEKSSGLTASVDFGVCYNPEFLREGSSVSDFWNPPFTLVGCSDSATVAVVREIYDAVAGDFIETGIGEAEMIKYVSNVFHALKVTFANEIGTICKAVGVDSHEVMNIFKQDHKLNISEAYLSPGFAFGGSCLPKDLRALTSLARMTDVETPVVSAILPSNRRHVDRAFEMIREAGSRKVGFFGMSFKAGTDDLRESPLVELIERSIGKGYDVLVYDENVSLADLHGSNREYIVREIPHIASLLRDDLREVLDSCDTLVIGNHDEAFEQIPDLATADHLIVDLVRLRQNGRLGRCFSTYSRNRVVMHRHCMIVHSYYPVGETRVQRQALALRDSGIDVDVLCLRNNGEARSEIIDGVRVTRLPVKRHKGRGMAAQLLEYLAFFVAAVAHMTWRTLTRRYQTVQVHNLPDFLVFSALPAKVAGARVILDLHDLMPELFAGRLDRQLDSRLVRAIAWQERIACRFADHVITVTDDWERTLHTRSCASDKTSVVMNLADPKLFSPAASTEDTSDNGDTVEIIYHGTFTERYGVDLLVRAFATAAASNPALRLTLLGDGEARPLIAQLVDELNIGSLVTVSESMVAAEQLPSYLATADIGIVPNRQNVFTDGILPTKLLEYVAVRIPAIVSRTTATEQYFDDSMVRFVEPGSTSALATAIGELANDPALRRTISTASARFDEAHHWSREAHEYVESVVALLPQADRAVTA